MKAHSPSRPIMASLAFAAAITVLGCGTSKPPARAEGEQADVGYGTQDKDNVTGAVGVIDAEKANEERPASSVADLLKGRVSGVHVTEAGGGIQVRIRGATSIHGSNDPLFVVNGVPVTPDPGGVLPFVNPYDVKSITVLKDASATAIYGSRGANGVVVIELK